LRSILILQKDLIWLKKCWFRGPATNEQHAARLRD